MPLVLAEWVRMVVMVGGSGGMSSNGGRRNGNVCQKVKDGMVKNGRNNAKCA